MTGAQREQEEESAEEPAGSASLSPPRHGHGGGGGGDRELRRTGSWNSSPLKLKLKHSSPVLRTARMLLNLDADPNAPNRRGEVPLHVLCGGRHGHRAECLRLVELLLKMGALPDMQVRVRDVSVAPAWRRRDVSVASAWRRCDVGVMTSLWRWCDVRVWPKRARAQTRVT